MKKTLKKIQEELAKESPDLSYIRGMLEVLIEDEPHGMKTEVGNQNTISPITSPSTALIQGITSNIDEASILDSKAAAHIAKYGKPKMVTE